MEEMTMPNREDACCRIDELCQIVNMPTQTIIKYVEYGIVEPSGHSSGKPSDWEFDLYVVNLVKKATRIQTDFDIDMEGVALVMDLLKKMERLETENRMLRQRLNRFLEDQ
jgi:chaperone modulatory protein CbpM